MLMIIRRLLAQRRMAHKLKQSQK